MSKNRKLRKNLQAEEIFIAKSKIVDFFIKPEMQLSVKSFCGKYATESYAEHQSSFASF